MVDEKTISYTKLV